MSNQFIDPNWHVLLIHYPIAFLSGGILIELLSFLWPRGFFRAAGRWMILLGALLSVPALAAGIYAFRDVVAGPETEMLPWHQVVRESPWSNDQWHFMRSHILLNCIGVGLVVIGVLAWVAASDLWRRRLYYPVLFALLCGMGAFGAASWFGGESVYRFGTAVGVRSADTSMGTAAAPESPHDIKWYIPPIELHIVLAGLVAAISLGALALTIRRLERPSSALEPAEVTGPERAALRAPTPVTDEPLELVSHDESLATVEGTVPAVAPVHPSVAVPVPQSMPYPTAPAMIPPARFWLLAFLAALCTVTAGVWSVIDTFSSERLSKNWQSLLHPNAHYRLPLHALFGSCLLLLMLILSLIARYGRRRRGWTGSFLIVAVLIIAIQFWLGIAMYYDGHRGPIYRFNPPGLAQ